MYENFAVLCKDARIFCFKKAWSDVMCFQNIQMYSLANCTCECERPTELHIFRAVTKEQLY